MARQIGSMVGPGRCVQRPTAILFDLDLTEVGKIVDDALPFEPAMAGRETVEELLAQDQSEKGAEDVAADAGVGL